MIEKTLENDILTLRLAHGRASALDIELLEALSAALDEAHTASAVVLTGTDKIFCAGVDLKRILEGRQVYAKRFVPLLDEMLEKLFVFPKPVVAAVNGHAIAGGCILALACDYRVMTAGKGRIGVPEMRVGVPLPVSALEALRFTLPKPMLQAVLYQGLTYLPEQAGDYGLVDEVVDGEELMPRSMSLAQQFAAIPANTFTLSKQMLRSAAIERIAHLRKTQGQQILDCWSDDATYAHIQEFVKKTMG